MEESASKAARSHTEEIVLVAELQRVEHGGAGRAAGEEEILGRCGEADIFDVPELRQLPVLSFEGEEVVNGERASRRE